LPITLASSIFNPRTIADFEGHGEGIGVYTDWRSRQYQAHQELTVVEAILLRFDTRHTPSGRFPVYSDKTGYGYDAAMCVQKYEPWVVETQNTSIASPSALRIIERGNCNTSLPPSGNIHGARISNTRCLDSTGKELAFELGFDDARRVISGFEESGPSPIVGPAVPPYDTFLISTYSTGRFYDRWHWTMGIHRTLPRQARHHPRTDRGGLHTTILCGVRTRRRTIVQGPDPSIYHL